MRNLESEKQTSFLYTWANTGETELVIIKEKDINKLQTAYRLEKQGNYKPALQILKNFGRTIKPEAFYLLLEDLSTGFSLEERCCQVRLYLTGLSVKMAINAYKEGYFEFYKALYRVADAMGAFEYDFVLEDVKLELGEYADNFLQ